MSSRVMVSVPSLYRGKNDLSLTYIFDDIVEAAMSDETWELPEESHRALCGVDAAFMLLLCNQWSFAFDPPEEKRSASLSGR